MVFERWPRKKVRGKAILISDHCQFRPWGLVMVSLPACALISVARVVTDLLRDAVCVYFRLYDKHRYTYM